jgi:hypothetical protein
MPTKKLYKVNDRMLRWMQYSIERGKADNKKDWCSKVGFPFANLSQVRRGDQGFTLEQIEQASKLINGNINWLFNLEVNMLRKSKIHTPMELLNQAKVAIETELKRPFAKAKKVR